MRAMSHSSTIGLYIRERFALRIYLPLSFFLASGLMAIQPDDRNCRSFVKVLLLFLVLLFPLRLLDDLSSIEEDRQMAPERVLCRTEDLRYFRTALYGAFFAAACLLLLFTGAWNGLAYGLLFWGLHLWYVLASGFRSRMARGLVPLIKYPLLILLVSSGPIMSRRNWVLGFSVSAAFVAYELLHDPGYGRAYSWLRGWAVGRWRIFPFLPFAGMMVWFGMEVILRK
jgi:hypothetical protein